MVRKTDCPTCKGNKIVTVKSTEGATKIRTCPECGGQGYKIRLNPYR